MKMLLEMFISTQVITTYQMLQMFFNWTFSWLTAEGHCKEHKQKKCSDVNVVKRTGLMAHQRLTSDEGCV